MKQTRFMSMVEAVTNVVVDYAIAVATQLAVFPMFGIDATLSDNLQLGLVFTGISLLLSYVLRRAFEHWRIERERNSTCSPGR